MRRVIVKNFLCIFPRAAHPSAREIVGSAFEMFRSLMVHTLWCASDQTPRLAGAALAERTGIPRPADPCGVQKAARFLCSFCPWPHRSARQAVFSGKGRDGSDAVPALFYIFYTGIRLKFCAKKLLFAHSLPLPLGEVTERSEDGEGIPRLPKPSQSPAATALPEGEPSVFPCLGRPFGRRGHAREFFWKIFK